MNKKLRWWVAPAVVLPVVVAFAASFEAEVSWERVFRQLFAGNPDEETRRSLEEKIKIAERDRREQEEGKVRRAGRSAEALQTVLRELESEAATETSWPAKTGIFEGVEGPWPSTAFRTENAWGGYIDGAWVNVYAGSSPEDPDQGRLIVVTGRADNGSPEFNAYLSPDRTGSLRIIAADGEDLLLESKSGQRYPFNLRTRTFGARKEKGNLTSR